MGINPECHKCPHARKIAGTHHLSCHHPSLDSIWKLDFASIVSIIGGVPPFISEYKINESSGKAIIMDPYGISKGWAGWPFNFDPIWLRFCIFWAADHVNKLLDESPEKLAADLVAGGLREELIIKKGNDYASNDMR